MITAISGGTGSVKLLRGLYRLIEDVVVIVNVGDNMWFEGLYICPDIDTVMYALAGILDEKRGWGIHNDTFHFMEQIAKYGYDTWFNIGDKDLATHVVRTSMLKSGIPLSTVTERLRSKLGVKWRILPASDHHIETRILTRGGEDLHLQEFWVKRKAIDEVKGVIYRGIENAKPAHGVVESIINSTGIIICPANPITSIGPTLAILPIKEALKKTNAKVVGISPILGSAPFSGPAGKLMDGLDLKVSPLTVAKLYSEFLDVFFIDKIDTNLKDEIERLGIKPLVTDIMMKSVEDEKRLASEVLECLKG
ncbi:MAG: 2-phospho-L-lactate transferase [Nitrososphaerales archaeon]|nr:2-phospho-L-lactate transferase [Nitrososphaerales archaeon]